MPAASTASNSSGSTAWGKRSTTRCARSFPTPPAGFTPRSAANRDLLAYLVRRLLENGANSSFVSVAADPNVPIADILRRPQSWIVAPQEARNRRIPLPRDLYQPERRNSAGIEFGERAGLEALLREVRDGTTAQAQAAPLIDGVALAGIERDFAFAD